MKTLNEAELIERFGKDKYFEANKRVWACLDKASQNSITFQSLLKLIESDLEVEF